jgi:hypothetical protein
MVAEWRIRYTQDILRSSTELGEEEVAVLVEVVKQGDLRFVRDTYVVSSRIPILLNFHSLG